MTAAPFAERLEHARYLIAHGRPTMLSISERDQLQAAERDTGRLARDTQIALRLLQPRRGWYEKTGPTHPDHHALLLAAILACVSCVHLRRSGPQPAIARLPLQRIDCQRCAQTLQKPPPDEADRCDICGTRGIDWFTPFLVRCGPLLIGGDVCRACSVILGVDNQRAA